jgi:HTH-type transcriptional regulator / antitoxin HipB
MLVRSPADVGRLLKERRIKNGLSQQELAESIGVSRQWVVKVERGHARAEIGSVLRAFRAVGIWLDSTTRVRLD